MYDELLAESKIKAIESDIDKARKVVDEILAAEIETLKDRQFLLDLLKRFGCTYQNWALY